VQLFKAWVDEIAEAASIVAFTSGGSDMLRMAVMQKYCCQGDAGYIDINEIISTGQVYCSGQGRNRPVQEVDLIREARRIVRESR
jgi:hypothetical protein